ncbi:hypothetical protein [Persicobacter psychrovividus]|uniref:MORN repeat protein n=1 Tax=Persicobacter psychrovividus TaxID=387638 RepID=A0ABM7VCC6_9BACT|nr:hypothetical protein PEPS_08310 [Persicobacter psychrovividus]
MKKLPLIQLFLIIALGISILANFLLLNREEQEVDPKQVQLLEYYEIKRNADSLMLSGEYSKALERYQEANSLRPATFSSYVDSMTIALSNDLHDHIALGDRLSNHLKKYQGKENILAKDTLKKKQMISHLELQWDSLLIKHNHHLQLLEEAEGKIAKLELNLHQANKSVLMKTFKNQDGVEVKYIGHTINDQAEGYGYAIFDKKGFYEGHWAHNKRNGKGTYYWANGDIYKGEYVDGKRSGIGTYHFSSGEKYIGGWKNDLRDGEGKIIDAKGKEVASGTWVKDELQKDKTKKKK